MIKLFFTATGLFVLSACSTSKISTATSQSAPVETMPAHSPQYKPAFEGQTRVEGRVTEPSAYFVKIITQSLVKPWSLAAMPTGEFLVTLKGGSLHIVNINGTVSKGITGVPTVDSAGQGGLLGVVLDPAFASNRMVYFTFSEPVTNGNHLAVAKARLSADNLALENVSVIYRVKPTYDGDAHNGGKLAFNNDGNLFVSSGERSDLATRPLAQDNGSSLGKILLITPSGVAVTDPLMLPPAGQLPEIFSAGHRNPLGIAIHPVTGELWESEMGPKGGDEINIIRRAVNYGWPVITYGIEYNGQTIGQGLTQKAGYEQPVYYWDPAISPGGIAFYTGSKIPAWRNNLFVASLSAKHLIRLVLDGNKIVGEERLLTSENQRFRDVTTGTDGKLYAITDEGRLYCLSND